MTITVGDKLPQHEFQILSDSGMTAETTESLFAGKKVALFAVPGAFTPTCSEAHLPGFVALADKIQEKGVDSIVCMSVNDAFVMQAWGKSQNAENLIMLADGDGEFTKALGLEMQTGGFGGLRSQRFSMVVNNGEVEQLFVEEAKGFKVSSAEYMLEKL